MKKVEDNQMATPQTVKNYGINWDKIKSVKDIKLLLKSLGMSVSVTGDQVPVNIKPLFQRGFLKQIK